MAFLTKEDKTVIQSMQSDEKEVKKMQAARKNKGKRSMGRSMSKERLKEFAPIKLEYDKKILEQNLKENNKILKESGREEIKWEDIYDDIEIERATSELEFEHYIELSVTDSECRIIISDNNFNRSQEWATKLGKPSKKLKTGELYWTLPSNYFVFGGKRFSISNASGQSSHGEVHILWSSQNPGQVVYDTDDSRWITHAKKLSEKNECEIISGRRKKGIITQITMYCPVNLMKIPNKK